MFLERSLSGRQATLGDTRKEPRMKNARRRKLLPLGAALLAAVTLTVSLASCGKATVEQRGNITFADAGWDSNRFHNAVAGLIAESAYGYTWNESTGSTTVTVEGVKKNEIDVNMETWSANIATYEDDLASGGYHLLGTNFDDNIQGFYVPRYVIEGDPERGIEPMAPDLKTVTDLMDYADLFVDEEDKSRGRIYGAIPGWEIDTILYKKYELYGLDKEYNYFRSGSDASLSAVISSAYDKGEPIVTYYWEPTWLMG